MNETVRINIPFEYTIGEEGYFTGKILKTTEDCIAEFQAELEYADPHSWEFEVNTL